MIGQTQYNSLSTNDRALISKYLHNYAEPQTLLLDGLSTALMATGSIENPIRHVLVIPCFDESTEDVDAIRKFCRNKQCLLILVINQPVTQPPSKKNYDLAQQLLFSTDKTSPRYLEGTKLCWQAKDNSINLISSANSNTLIVDCFSEGRRLNEKMGVGLARKIGSDIACQLIVENGIGEPWVFCSDADVTFSPDYFNATKQASNNTAAIVLAFEHKGEARPELRAPQALYDLHLNYYVAGLQWALSPYAYHSLGSTQIISAAHYAKVRGFPKKNAGEDFYLLNKLCKTGRILQPESPRLLIETRLSTRTPFGTGRGVQKILGLDNALDEYLFYHPEIFTVLRVLLAGFPTLWREDIAQSKQTIKDFNWNNQSATPIRRATKDLALTALKEMQFDETLHKTRMNSKD